ncbi:hypothetical protein ACFLVP_01175 [Chloroflexota bacterium]
MSKGNPKFYSVAVPIRFKTQLEEEQMRLECYTMADCIGQILAGYFKWVEEDKAYTESLIKKAEREYK